MTSESIWCLLPSIVAYIVCIIPLCGGILARSDLCGRPAFQESALSESHLIHRRAGSWDTGLVISNSGINLVSDRITTIINRSASSRPFNFPPMIERKYFEAAFMFYIFKETQSPNHGLKCEFIHSTCFSEITQPNPNS